MNVKHISNHHKITKSLTNWDKVRKMTEAKIIHAARSDRDAQPLSKKQLKYFKRVNPIRQVEIKLIRHKLGLSQEEFAHYFGVSQRTIQEWEQHRRIPTATARNFLKVIESEPTIVQKILRSGT
ncbi:MAG: helix-turn-helix domain-containing protein [Gammaproteobacteria bacterium]|nr:helix-turn-helix domain-containing protein [Gammaproteobacteria bacterium]